MSEQAVDLEVKGRAMHEALATHWPEYLMEAAELGLFMISACVFVVLLGYPRSPVHELIADPLARRLLIGIAMGLTAIAIVYSPLGQRSGAHFNPAVTCADASQGGLPWSEVPGYVLAQLAGGFVGVAVAHFMFEEHALFFASQHTRTGAAQWLSEFVATFGLLSVIWGCARRRPGSVPFAVGAYITAAYWFTSSTSFANPAVTLARAASDTFAGIRPVDAPAFIVAQLLGAAAATWLFRWLVPALPLTAATVADRVDRVDREELA